MSFGPSLSSATATCHFKPQTCWYGTSDVGPTIPTDEIVPSTGDSRSSVPPCMQGRPVVMTPTAIGLRDTDDPAGLTRGRAVIRRRLAGGHPGPWRAENASHGL
jgi:hypothetical protein